MTGAAAAYVLGAFFVSFFTDAHALVPLCSVIAVCIFMCAAKGFKSKDFSVLSIFFTIGLTVCGMYTAFCYNSVTAYNGQTCSFSGRITEIHDYGESSSYVIKGRINGDQSAAVTYYGDSLDADYGDTISIASCVMNIPRSDFLFDSEGYYKANGIFLSANKAEGVTLERNNSRLIKNALMDYRDRMAAKFVDTLGRDCGGFLSGMVFGCGENVDSSIKTAVYRCGFGHVLAVSGLHVSIIAFVMLFILKRLRVNRYVRFAAVDLMIIALIIMADAPLSAIRAAIMTNFLMAAGLFRRQNDVASSLSGAVLLICVFQPFSIFSAGFQMSVAGTFGIGIAAPYLTERLPDDMFSQKIIRPFAAALITTVTVFPLSIYYFGETSLISPVMNVLLVPLCSAAMIAGVLYVMSGGLLPVLKISGALIDFVLYVSDKASHFRWSYLASDEPMIMITAYGCACIIAVICVMTGSRLLTAAVGMLSCAVIFIESAFIGMDFYREPHIAVLGRDSNAAVVLTYNGWCEVIDLSGSASNANYVRKYLSVNGIDRIDSLVLVKNSFEQTEKYFEALTFTDIDYIYRADNNTYEQSISGTNECEVTLSAGALSIRYKNDSVNFLPSARDDAEGICYYYGYQYYNELSGCILDSGTNNIELVPDEDGRFFERRL